MTITNIVTITDYSDGKDKINQRLYMNLSFIKTNKCPHCGCSFIVREEVQTNTNYRGEVEIRRHAHGGHWETRAFACGLAIKYSPNFEREEQASQCTKSKEYMDKQRVHQEEIQKRIAELG